MLFENEPYWGTKIAELEKSLSDLNRWIAANEDSARTFARIGCDLEANMMRNAADAQIVQRARVELMLEAARVEVRVIT